jgi:hypothetical protein
MIPRYASYRDPRSRLVATNDRVVRRFDASGADAFRSADESGVLTGLVEDGLITPYEIVSTDPFEVAADLIPFVSYPTEWTAGMLRAAGLVTLSVARKLWNSGFHLRDASAHNIVFNGAKPIFVDLGSIGVGHTPSWSAYGQFCDHFLNPLLIAANLAVPLKEVLGLEGIPASTTSSLLYSFHRFGRGVLTNVKLRDRLERKHASDTLEQRASVRRDLRLPPGAIDALMTKMERTLHRMTFGRDSHWVGYDGGNTYTSDQEDVRDSAIRRFAAANETRTRAVDIGANTGRHSDILSESFSSVISIDSDPAAVESHRERLIGVDKGDSVFPVVGDLASPTPARGFMNEERASLIDRIADSDAALWMAVIHHLSISRAIPLSGLAELAVRLAPRHLVEFVGPEDPMAQLLSAGVNGEHHPYSIEVFLAAFGQHFEIKQVGRSQEHRTLFELRQMR